MVPADADKLHALVRLAERTRPLTRADEQVLPVGAPFDELLPWGGLRRGSTVTTSTRALGFALIAKTTQAGSWAAMVGVPAAGLAAAGELGVELDRFAVVATPPVDLAPTVVAALVDAVDVVVIGSALALARADARRLAARVRERGSVLVAVGDTTWPEGADVRFGIGRSHWVGLEQGHGALCGHRVEVLMTGRGAAARPRQAWCWLQGRPGPRWSPVADRDMGEQRPHEEIGSGVPGSGVAGSGALPLSVARAG